MAEQREIDSALLRSRVYGFLRRVFTREVDEALLAWYREQARRGLWCPLELDLGAVLKAADSEALLEDLAVDFCRLFVTSGSAGSPHESVHARRSGSGGKPTLLWGDPASEMKDLYREAGFELEEAAHQLPDALGVELEFMEKLGQREAAARGESPEEVQRLQALQLRMVSEHLGKWVPEYGRKLRDRAETDFYRVMLGLLADFVQWEVETMTGGLRAELPRAG